MRCQYCDTEITEGALFCENCGLSVDSTNNSTQNVDDFWQKENNNKLQDNIRQIAGLKGKCEQIQGDILRGKKLKSRSRFFRIMLVFVILCLGILVFSICKYYENANELSLSLGVASLFTITALLIIAAFATIIIKKGAIGLLYPIIPIFGYYYFLYSVICAIGRFFIPLKRDEIAFVKELPYKYANMKLLKKEEKDLKAGLNLMDKEILNTPSLKHLKKTIVTQKQSLNGWQVTAVISMIILTAVFAVSYHFAPTIITSIVTEGGSL